jgi:hypothetical protein
LVVCPRPCEESMTWKPVSNNRLRRVPKRYSYHFQHTFPARLRADHSDSVVFGTAFVQIVLLQVLFETITWRKS